MNLSDLTAALRARWRLELAIALLVLLLVGLWTLTTPRQYVATATLLFETNQADAVASGEQKLDSSSLATQADIIKSATTASEMVKRLGMANDPNVQARWVAAGSPGTIEGWLGRQLLGNLDVVPGGDSSVLQVSYRSTNPNTAAELANGFASTFLDTRLRLATDPARGYARWFGERIGEARRVLEQAQQRLVAYQKQTGVINVGSSDVETARLSALEGQLAVAQAEQASARANASNSASASVQVQSAGVVQGLRSQIAAKTAELSQLRTTYGPNHPAMKAATAELATLQTKLNSEIGTSTASLQVASSAASSRVAELQARVNEQRRRVLALGTDQSQLAVLQRDVESARLAYDNVRTRFSTVQLQSELPSTNVRQLDEARAPVFPSSPNVPMRILIGVLLAAALAFGAAGLLEFLFPRVRTASGLAAAADAPVLGAIDLDRSGIAGRLQPKGALA